MEYSNREILTAVSFLIFVLYAIFRLRRRKLSLIDIKTDHLVLNRLLMGELTIYSEDIKMISIISNEKVELSTQSKKYTIDEYVNKDEIIKFCSKNKILLVREYLNDTGTRN
jgi:hypothetical protein